MNSFVQTLKIACATAIYSLYQKQIEPNAILVNDTKTDFRGDYTVVTFALSKLAAKKPDEIGEDLGQYLCQHFEWAQDYNVVKGFLNISFTDAFYKSYLQEAQARESLLPISKTGKKVMVEYSSPNTNKPLHFGHMRNIFLGAAMCSILEAAGNEVVKANLINDRGIHICKSMIAWQLFADGATPQSTGVKGDHLVGDYYVKYNTEYKRQVELLVQEGADQAEAEKKAPILLQAQELLRKWEAGDAEVLTLWRQMNSWVYDGFFDTYKKMGIEFDKMYYESETYLSGRDIVMKGLKNGVLYQKEDGSVWIDLTQEGLDHKLLLRGDGTSVYMTQDIGTAVLKYNDYGMNTSVYVIGDEQNYHMQVLKWILTKLKEPCADGIYHLSYGMVELPTGRMKSREGTVVDADDMLAEMIQMAKQNTEELGKVEGFSEQELSQLYATLGIGALKFYLLRVDPKKKMVFNPQESIDFHGFTGPFIQYCHARIQSILRKANDIEKVSYDHYELTPDERQLLKQSEQFETMLVEAANSYDPSILCQYLYQLAKAYNSFLVNHSVWKADNEEARSFRLHLSIVVKRILAQGLQLLGIHAPDRM